MPRTVARALTAAALAGLLALTAAAAPGTAQAQAPAHGTIVRAVDGDTLAVRPAGGGEVRVRLIGVDAPEVGGSGQAAECGGAQADDAEDRARTAERHVRRFYFLLNEGEHRRAWGLLSPGLRGRLGPYRRWRAGYRRTLSTRVDRVTVRLASGGAVADAAIRSRDRDACSGRAVASSFRVRWAGNGREPIAGAPRS